MCHEFDALPAVPHVPGTSVNHARPDLTASDGTSLSAFAATPTGSPRGGVVVLPDNRGLSSFYEVLACRIAELGYSAVAIDYYGRTAGPAPQRGADFPFMEHLMRVSRPGLEADLRAAVEFLRSSDGGACKAVFALGFCFGGRQAYFAATLGHGLAGVTGFYGFPGEIMGAPGPTARAAQIASPVLAIWAGADQIGVDQIDAFLRAMSDHGVEHESVTYPEAPHSFFDLKQADWQEASADAWNRVCKFLDRHSVSALHRRA